MRKRNIAVLVALQGVLVASLVGVAPAMAEKPEFTVQSGFTGTAGTTSFHGLGAIWTYTKGQTSGEKGSNKQTLSNVALSFSGAPAERGCENIESNTGISFGALKARLGYINKAKKEVGLMFEPATQPLTQCESFIGGGRQTKTYSGDFIAHITPIGVRTKEFALKFEVASNVQSPLFFEGETESMTSFPLTLGEYKCSIILEKEKCSHSGGRVGIESPEVRLKFTSETEIVG